jgi:hypothetical protein
MPFRKLILRPGVNLEQTPTLNQTQLAASSLVRFYAGLVQKLGGWLQLISQPFVGICRGLRGWADIEGNAYLAIGTDQRLAAVTGGALYDITPLTDTTNPAPAFTTTSGSPVVEIDDPSYSPSVGDWLNLTTQVSVGGLILYGFERVTSVIDTTHFAITVAANATSSVSAGGAVPSFTTANGQALVSVALAGHDLVANSLFPVSVSTTVGGITLSGNYWVTTVTDADHFVITAASAATSTATASENAGNVQIEYLLPTGYATNTQLSGYGIGDYGAGDYGIGDGGTAAAQLRQWSLDNWGQDLIASPTNGAIYYWQPPTVAPATVVSGSAPTKSVSVFVMPQVQIIIALGAEVSGTQEPLLIRWCDAGDFTDWTPSASNQAGSYQLPTGSTCVGGLAIGLGALIWTDVDLWQMTYQGLPFVFGFNRIAPACGLIAKRAAGTSGQLVMWLSTRGFFQYVIGGGGVVPIECPVWDFLFDNLDNTQLNQVHCAVNSLFNEMAWFFPIAPSSPLYNPVAPLGYVKVNYAEGLVWDYGLSDQYQRTAWVGTSPIGNPIGADLNGLLQEHEVAKDANGAPMRWSWQTGFFDLAEGEDFSFVDLLIPDFTAIGNPTINLTVLASLYPNGPTAADGPHPWAPSTNFVPVRARGRQIALSASGSDLGTFNRLGAVRYRFAADGRV